MSRKKVDMDLTGVKIDGIAAEGKAIAHVDGVVLFVPYGVPGDEVTVHVYKKKKNYMEGNLVSIDRPSPERQKPFCEHFGTCGGCKWQHLPYSMQLQAKQQQVVDQLVRIGHLDIPPVSPILASENTRFYRNKLEYSFSDKRWILPGEDIDSLTEKDRMGLGFHVTGFFDKVLDIKKCWLQRDPSNDIRLFIKQYALDHDMPFYDIRENRGLMRNMFIRTTEDGQVMVIVCFAENDQTAIKGLLDALAARFPEITSLYYVINTKGNDTIADQECILYKGDEAIYETMEGLHFRVGPKSFYQTNSPQAYRLYSVVRDFAALSGGETVYDLYTGTGTIAQFLSSKASKVIGIEYVEDAIRDARDNARRNSITNCEFFAGDMKDVLSPAFIARHGHPDVVVLDPPRAGIHPDVAKVLLETQAPRMVYVSCNPASQARDLAVLCQKYEITAVQPVDMFPHTQHVENVCALKLRDKAEN